MTENVFTPHTDAHRAASRANVAPQPGTAKRCLAEEPQDLRLSGCGIARDCGGALQFVRQEDACTTGQRERATTATSLAGQHRQQRAGVEEPASGRTSERAAGNNGRCCDGRSGACVCDARAAGRRRGLRPDRRCRALCSGPALPASAAGQHADATHARTTAGTADRRERTRTCGRLPFRFQPCVLPLRRTAATTTARPDDARPVWPCRTAGKQ